MKRLLLTLLTLIALYTVAFASPISEETAREKAARFILSKKEGTSSARSAQRFGGSSFGATLTSVESREAYYVFNIDSVNGYVIVSGDDRMPDVLGYAYHGTYKPEEIPENMRAWLQGYVEEYQYLQSHSDAKGASLTSVTGYAVPPLLECTWNQTSPYNNLCPKINGKTTYTGCVATAMAQVMYYHKWPKQTTMAIPAYTTESAGIYMPQIEITAIDWYNMIPSYRNNSGTSAQKQAVAKLMLLCGCAVKMNYGLDGSGAYCDPNVLTEYFGYNKLSVSEVRRSNYSSNLWNQMIYDELEEGRPVLYSGGSSEGGHQFVIDGYDWNDYFHVNWGWGGYQDNYFLLSSLNGFNSDQSAIIGIERQGSVNHKYAYAELIEETLTFYYDNKREIRAGTMFNINNHEWTDDKYRSSITTVNFDSSFGDYNYLVSTSSMFNNIANLTSIQGLEYLNTQNVTNMSYMFSGCTSLTSLDLSNFDTRNVTNMSSMFSGCASLTSLDISNFNTQNVTNMSWMFYGCSLLQDIYPGEFWSTQNVTSGDYMFYRCYELIGERGTQYSNGKSDYTYAHIDGGSDNPGYFSTKGYSYPYAVVSNDNKNLTFYYGNGREVPGSMRVKGYRNSSSRDWDSVAQSIETVVFDESFADCDNITGTSYWFYDCENLITIQGLEYLNTQNVTSMRSMFSDCANLTSLDLRNFNTQNVTDMYRMFGGCYSLQDIYSGENWSTQNVTSGDYMFSGCSELIGEKGTQYDSSKSDYTYAHIDGGEDNPGYFSTKGYSYPYAVISSDDKTLTFYYGNGKEISGSMRVKSYSYYTYRDWDSVSSSLETVVFDESFADCDNITNTSFWFYNFENLNSIQGLEYLNTKNVTNMNSMFCNCKNITSFDVNHFDTQNVTNMSSMFYNCNNLTSLDLSNFDTQNVTSMSSMFSNCSNLTSLEISNFDTQNVTNMSWMFGYCSSLQDIYTGENWSTQNVTSGNYMFYGCSELIGERGTQYDYSKSNYTYAHIDGGADNPGYLSTKGYSYPYVVISNDDKTLTFYYANGREVPGSMRVKSYSYYENRDWDSVASSLETVVFDESFADYDNITNTSYWFYNCGNLTSIQGLKYLNTQNVTNMPYMFSNCKNITSLDLSNFNTQNVTNMSSMFYNCNNLTSFDLSNFNTQNVTSMGSMFSGCASLTSLDLSNFNTQNVMNMYRMFGGCSSLQDIYTGENWSTQNVTSGNYMFSGCSELIGERGTQYDYSKSDYTYAHIDGGADNPGYFSTKGYSYPYPYAVISNDDKTLTFYYGNGREIPGSMRVKSYSNYSSRDWDSVASSLETVEFDESFADYDNIIGTSYWFYNCMNLTSIQGLKYLNTQNVTDMPYMFYNCKNITSLDLSNFNTQNVTNMSSMFYNCNNLTSVDLSNFNTQNVISMSYMFCGCISLQAIYAGEGWNTENVEYSNYMFNACRNLVGQDGTKYDYNYQDKTNAHYGAGGYLTYKSPVLRGDVNGDGEVNVGDLVSVSNFMAGDESVSKDAADVNQDGEVNVGDMVVISNIMSGNE